MRVILKSDIFSGAMRRVKATASSGFYTGQQNSTYLEDCKWYIEKHEALIIFTRDIGHHEGGWWKNPDYERCWHLSISFPKTGRSKNGLSDIVTHLFGDSKNLIWEEAPYSEAGKKRGVYHYRLFCDENWQPIKPRGEVYSTKNTPVGWKSWSELKYDRKK